MIYAVLSHLRIKKNEKCDFSGGALHISGAGGERVFGQFVIAPKKDLIVKSVQIHSLNNNTITESEIFWVYCVKVKKPSCSYGGTGEYPEVLVPVELISKKEKIVIDAESNQSFLISFVIGRGAKSGKYGFEVLVETDGEMLKLPAELEIFDFDLPKNNNAASAFAVWYENKWLKSGDRDKGIASYADSYDEYLVYYNLLKKYKIAATEMPVRSAAHPQKCAASDTHIKEYEPQRKLSIADIDNFIEAAKRYAADNEVSSYSLPYFIKDDGSGGPAIDTDAMMNFFESLVNASTKELDLFSKSYIYVTFIDEPADAALPVVRKVTDDIRGIIIKTAEKCCFDGKENVKCSLLALENVVTAWPVELIYGGVDTWCPTFQAWQAPEFSYGMKRMRDLGSKQWWYGCISPWYPYPSYHIDEPLLGARIEGLMRYRFGVKGNLYWAVNMDLYYDNDEKKYRSIDVYEDAMTFEESNGEGVLVYDGSRFGAKEPLASMRLAAICAGHQDYEYVSMLGELIKELNFDYAADICPIKHLRCIYDKISFNTACFAYGYDFEAARHEIADCITAAQKGILIDILNTDAKKQSADIAVYYPAGGVTQGDGKRLKSLKSGCGQKDLYRIKLQDKNNFFNLSVRDADGKTVKLKRLISPPVKNVELNSFKADGESIAVCKKGDGLLLRTKRFVNSKNNPSISLSGEFDFTDLDSFIIKTDSRSEDFILSISITDAYGKCFYIGYDIIERGENISRIHFNPVMQLRPGNENNCVSASAKYTKEQVEKNRIRIDRIVKITIETQNARVFCAGTPREIRFEPYDFFINGIYFTKWDGDNPHLNYKLISWEK